MLGAEADADCISACFLPASFVAVHLCRCDAGQRVQAFVSVSVNTRALKSGFLTLLVTNFAFILY